MTETTTTIAPPAGTATEHATEHATEQAGERGPGARDPLVRDGREVAARDSAARDLAAAEGRRPAPGSLDPLFGVRTADIEPYTGLRYLSKLFRMIAVVLVLLLIAEVVTGLVQQGWDSMATLLSEVSRLIVLAGLLWGAGDLAILLIDVGHDVRAARILLGRQQAHHPAHHPGPTRPRDEGERAERAERGERAPRA